MKMDKANIKVERLRIILSSLFAFIYVAILGAQINIDNVQVKKLDFQAFDVNFSIEGSALHFKELNGKQISTYNLKSGLISKGKAAYTEKGETLMVKASKNLTKIILVTQETEEKVLQPLGLNDYLNVQLSPDQTKILFRVSGLASFVTDLEGNIISKYENAEFPVWINNNLILYAKIEDDGYQYVSSDLFVTDIDQSQETLLTGDTDLVPLYPDFNNTTNQIVFNTPKGDVYLLKWQ